MSRLSFAHTWPLLAFLVVGGVAVSQTLTGAGRVFPYTGYLENAQSPVDGSVDMQVSLYTSSSGGTACDQLTFADVSVEAGSFTILLEDVDDACFSATNLYMDIAVGAPGDTLTSLTSGTGARVLVGAVPHAASAASQSRFFAEVLDAVQLDVDTLNAITVDADDMEGVTLRLQGSTTDNSSIATDRILVVTDTFGSGNSDDGGIEFRHNNLTQGIGFGYNTVYATGSNTNQLLRLQSRGTSELRLNVDDGGAVVVGQQLQLQSSLFLEKEGTTSTIDFASQSNDPGEIIHYESSNTGELWLSSSDDWDAAATNDRIVFGEFSSGTVRHEFLANGDAEHDGALTVRCPSGMSRIGSDCIDNTKNGGDSNATFQNAVVNCASDGKSMCTYSQLIACDTLNPSASDCNDLTSTSSRTAWTLTRHGERDDFDESWQNNIMCYRGDDEVVECNIGSGATREYFCCTRGVIVLD